MAQHASLVAAIELLHGRAASEAFEIVQPHRRAEVAPVAGLAPIVDEPQIAHEILEGGFAAGLRGPKGPSPELIAAICEMKRRNPNFGYQRIAHQLSLVLGVELDKDVVRRALAKHYRPDPGDRGISWLTFLGHAKDSLWSLDFFRCESLILKTHWVMVVIDQYTRRIVGFAVHAGTLNGPTICRMFGRIATQAGAAPTTISSDHDPLFEFHQWKANLRILEIGEIKTVPDVPLSHPFVERLIGTANWPTNNAVGDFRAGDA